ncbi:hypothetical protein ABKN59_007915 [Abortiporus biennis]
MILKKLGGRCLLTHQNRLPTFYIAVAHLHHVVLTLVAPLSILSPRPVPSSTYYDPPTPKIHGYRTPEAEVPRASQYRPSSHAPSNLKDEREFYLIFEEDLFVGCLDNVATLRRAF